MTRVEDLVRRLTDVYNRESSGNCYKVLSIEGSEYDEINDMLEDVLSSHFVEDAIGESLDNVGKLLGLIRETSETDDQFRARILARVQGFIGGGTKPSITAALVEFIGIDKSYFEVVDGYDVPLGSGIYGHFIVIIDIGAPWGTLQDLEKVTNLVESIKAAGTVFDGIGTSVYETISVVDLFYINSGNLVHIENISMTDNTVDLFIHRTDITYTNSMNVII